MDLGSVITYIFGAAAAVAAVGTVALRNPVSSALSLALCMAFVAAVFFGAGATFMGIVQLLVYAGAILVLFLFIIMMLDVKKESMAGEGVGSRLVGVVLAGVAAGMLSAAALRLPGADGSMPDGTAANCYGGPLPALRKMPRGQSDASMLGTVLYGHYNFALVILGLALAAGAAGAVAVGRRIPKN